MATAASRTQILKDHEQTIVCTYTGDEDLSDATITWGFFAYGVDWSKDLDTLLSSSTILTKTTTAGEVTITDGVAGTFTVALGADDLATQAPGCYWTKTRIITATGKELTAPAVRVTLIATARG